MPPAADPGARIASFPAVRSRIFTPLRWPARNVPRRARSRRTLHASPARRRACRRISCSIPPITPSATPTWSQAGVNMLQHYLENGWREGRDPHPLVDLKLLKPQLGADFAGDPLRGLPAIATRPQLRPHRCVDPDFLAAQQRRLERARRPAGADVLPRQRPRRDQSFRRFRRPRLSQALSRIRAASIRSCTTSCFGEAQGRAAAGRGADRPRR